MKKIFFILIINLFLSISIGAQERFFELVPGWRNVHIEETPEGYLSLGLGQITGGAGIDHTYISARINNIGQTVDYTETILDTANIISLRPRHQLVTTIGNEKLVVGMKKYAEYRYYGLLVWYNEDMTEVNDFRTYDLGWNARFSTVNHPNDSTILVGGYISATNNPSWTDPILINMDLEGNIRWQEDYHCGDNCRGYMKQVIETDDGGYLLIVEQNETIFVNHRNQFYRYIKVNILGDIEWTHTAGTNPDLRYYSSGAIQLDDGNILIAYSDAMYYQYANHTWNWNEDTKIYFEKLDINSGILYSSQIIFDFAIGTPKPVNILISQDGSVVISAWWGPYVGLLKYTTNGELIWTRQYILYPGTSPNTPYNLIETSDGGFMLCGQLTAFDEDNSILISAYVFKTDEYGCLEEDCQLTDNITETTVTLNNGLFSIFPNPNKGITNISFTKTVNGKLSVFNALGVMVFEKEIASANDINLDISKHNSGLYLIRFVSDSGEVFEEKMIME